MMKSIIPVCVMVLVFGCGNSEQPQCLYSWDKKTTHEGCTLINFCSPTDRCTCQSAQVNGSCEIRCEVQK